MKQKELAVAECVEVLSKSWPWARLTDDERKRFVECAYDAERCGAIFGDYRHRWHIVMWLWHAFLEGLNYTATGWRETHVNGCAIMVAVKEV